VIGDGTRD